FRACADRQERRRQFRVPGPQRHAQLRDPQRPLFGLMAVNRACVLLPDWNRCVASTRVANGILSYWIARGDRRESRPAGIEQALRELFEFSGKGFPTAALSRQIDAGDVAGSTWLRADPAHVRADMTTARMLACGELGLSASETSEIAKSLKPLFGDAG